MPDKHDDLGCYGSAGFCKCQGTAIYYGDAVKGEMTSLYRRGADYGTVIDMVDESGFGSATLVLEGCTCKHMLFEHDTHACWHKGCPCTGRIVRERDLAQHTTVDCCPCTSLEETQTCTCDCHQATNNCCDHPATWEAVFGCDCPCHIPDQPKIETEHENVAAAILEANAQLDAEERIRLAQARLTRESHNAARVY